MNKTLISIITSDHSKDFLLKDLILELVKSERYFWKVIRDRSIHQIGRSAALKDLVDSIHP